MRREVIIQPPGEVLVRAVERQSIPSVHEVIEENALSGLRSFVRSNDEWIRHLQGGRPEDRDGVPKEVVNLILTLRKAGVRRSTVLKETVKVFTESVNPLPKYRASDYAKTFVDYLAEIGKGMPPQPKSK